MTFTGQRTLGAALAIACLAFAPVEGRAQGFFGSAGVLVDQGYESNLFATPDGFGPGASDMIMRVGPAVEGGYRSPRSLFIGRYALSTERYGEHTSLSRRIGQQDARVEASFWPTARLAVGGSGEYLESQTPHAFLTGGTLIYGRVPAHRLQFAPALTYDFNSSFSLAMEYQFTREALGDVADDVIHAPHIGIDWHATPLTTWRLLYRARRFGPPGRPAEMTQSWLVGVDRELSRFTDLEVQAGARLFESEVRPEATAVLRRRLRRGELHVTATQSETSLLGAPGIMNTRSLQAGITFHVARYVRLTTSPSLFHTWRDQASATVRGVELEATAFVARGVALEISGLAARQRGNLGGPVESVPFFRIQAGVRVLYPGRPQEDMIREIDGNREREDERRPGGRAR